MDASGTTEETVLESLQSRLGLAADFYGTRMRTEIPREESIVNYTDDSPFQGVTQARISAQGVSFQLSDLPPMLSGLDEIRAQMDSLVEDVPSWKRKSHASNLETPRQEVPSVASGSSSIVVPRREDHYKHHGGPEDSLTNHQPDTFERERQAWDMRQKEQLAVVRACLSERDDLKRQVAAGKDAIEQFRREMMVAVDRLSSQRQKWLSDVDIRDAEIEKLHAQLGDNEKLLGENEREIAVLKQAAQCATAEQHAAEDEAARVREELARVAVHLSDAKAQLARAENNADAETERLQNEIGVLRSQYQNELRDRDAEMADLKAAAREADAKLRKLDMDLSSSRHDCDNLRSEAALTQAKHDAAVASAVAQAKAQCEREALAREREAKDATAAEMTQTRDRHREQLDAQLTRHRDELADVRQQRDADTTRHRRELETERDAHAQALGDLQWKLHEAQARLLAVQQRTEARDAALANAGQVATLGTQLQSTLQQQFDTVARAAHALTEASKTLTEETSSIVNDVASEVHDAGDLGTRPYPGPGRSTLATSLSAVYVQGLPASPNRGLRMMVQAGTTHAPTATPSTSDGAAGAGRENGDGTAITGASSMDSVASASLSRARPTLDSHYGATTSSTGSTDNSVLARTDNSVLARALHYRYTGSSAQPLASAAAIHASRLTSATSAFDRLSDSLSSRVDGLRAAPWHSPVRVPVDNEKRGSTLGERTGTSLLAWSSQMRTQGSSTVPTLNVITATTSGSTTATTDSQTTAPARDYDKPWLAGIQTYTQRSRPVTLDASVADVYQMLRKEKEHARTAHMHPPPHQQSAEGANLVTSAARGKATREHGHSKAEQAPKKRVWR